MGNGMEFQGNEEPLLHVIFWASKVQFSTAYMGYPLVADPTDPYKILENRLIAFGDLKDGWNARGFVFSLRLLTLDSSQALIERVINPAIALLKGETDVKIALPDDLPGLVMYPDGYDLSIAVKEVTTAS